MSVKEYCNREVVIVEKTESIRKAVELMRSYHVGDVIAVEKRNGSTVPVGILTDRDIVIEILAKDVDFDQVSIGDVMSYQLVTIEEDTELMEAIKLMRSRGVRRAPVVNVEGSLVGIFTVDDVLALIAEQLVDIANKSTISKLWMTKPRHSFEASPTISSGLSFCWLQS